MLDYLSTSNFEDTKEILENMLQKMELGDSVSLLIIRDTKNEWILLKESR